MGKTSKTMGDRLADMDNRLMGLEAASRERVENEQALQRRVAKLAADGGDMFERIDELRGRVEELGKWAHPPVDFQPMLDRVDNAFDNIGAHNEALADIINRIAALEKWCYPRMDVQPTLDRITALENQIRDLNRGLPMLKPAKPVPKPILREVSEEQVRHAAACIGAVGVLRALVDYLGNSHRLADTLTSAADYALKIRILNEAIEKVEAMG